MKVLVTGAGGFVGRRLTPKLEQAGHDVTACDLEVDVTDPVAVAGILDTAEPDAIVHLAALSSVAASMRDPASCFRANYLGTRCLLQGVAAKGTLIGFNLVEFMPERDHNGTASLLAARIILNAAALMAQQNRLD